MGNIEQRTIAKVSKRLVPFLVVCYFVAYLDRVNVSFAALTMNQDLGLSQTAFGFGAGIFFIAYFIFEVPSNLLLERFGARKWIARIMLSWGILSGLMAFIPEIGRATGLGNENSFYMVRVLLGVAEAGFFPGIIFYLTLWFPAEYRAHHRRVLYGSHSALNRYWRPYFRRSAVFARWTWTSGLAVAFHHRSCARDPALRGRVLLSHRPPS